MAADRRSFLRDLVTLPLVGGSVALIGSPTQAAVPVTDALLDRYIAWLAVEYGEAFIERDGRRTLPEWRSTAVDLRREWCRENAAFNPDPSSDRFRRPPLAPPSTRAAVILSAAGVPLVPT